SYTIPINSKEEKNSATNNQEAPTTATAVTSDADEKTKIWWYKRIQPDDDLPHPPIGNYHPPLAPEDLERQWPQSQDSGFEE
ncbi:hypothetical protein PV325_009817, partial [Microctonus aethiopoides]